MFVVRTACVVLMTLVAYGQAPSVHRGGIPTTLEELRNNSRVLLIFAPSAGDARLEAQLRSMEKHAAGVSERQLVVIAVPYQGAAQTQYALKDAEAVRERFRVARADFAVILVGKDGGEKLRDSKPLTFARLQATIDAMPMRRQEMKERAP